MALQAPNAKAVGFKLFKEHVRCAGTRRLFSWLAGQYPDLHVIHIVRPNRLDAWVSRQLAKRSGVWETALPASKLIVNYTSCASYFYETPSDPAANTGRLYFKDNGAGKTQLAVRFPTEAVQVLVTEP